MPFPAAGFLVVQEQCNVSVPLAVTHLLGSLEGDGCVPAGQAVGDLCLRALSLCRCRQGWDDFTHHNAVPQCVGPLPLCTGQGTPAPPCFLIQRESLGTGTDPHLSDGPGDPWLGLVGSNTVTKPDDVPSLVSGPLPWNSFVFFLNPISQPALTDICKRPQILALVQNSV